MAQWAQGQPGFQYPMQTGFPGQFQAQNNLQFQPQNQQFPPQGQSFQQPLMTQPTGFPQRPGFPQQGSGFIQSQPTGFVGANFASRPAPPVPALPPQFQSNPPSFLNAPPPVPQRTLLPQQTGFPGQSPLVPQVTGFVDPRLQMMASTFMPSMSGGMPLLSTQQLPSGLSLQQTIQQHNAQRGTVAPKIPWALSKSEKKSYDNIFRAWDTKGTGFISGETALEVFGQSGLPKDELARIWTLADSQDRGKLNVAEFHVAMGLIYRRLNGNDMPEQLPQELVPPSSKDLGESVDFVKDLLRNDTRARSPSNLDAPVSRLKDRSFNSSESSLGPGRDATIYRHNDDGDGNNYYSPRSRHVNREAIRTRNESDTPEGDLKDLKNMLSNTVAMLDKAAEDDASRTAEDEALDRELDDLKYRVKHLKDDLDYYSRPPRSAEKDRERRALERELMSIMHEKVPEVERKIKAREERREREKRQWARDRDRANERFGRYNDRDDYSRYDEDRPRSRNYDRDDRDSRRDDKDYRRDDRDYRRRSPSRERERDREYDRDRDYERDRPRSPVGRAAPAPPAPESTARSPPPAPKPTPSPAPAMKNMTAAERQAYARAEAQRRIEARKAALGLVAAPSSSTPDTTVEDRLQQERKEAEEKARAAEKEAEEREALRKERLHREKNAKEEFNSPPAPTPTTKAAPPAPSAPSARPAAAKAAPPPPRSRVPPVAPPPRAKVAIRAPPAPSPPVTPQEPEVDPEEEALRAKEEAIRKQREERAARLKRLQEEEEREAEAARLEEDQARQRIYALKSKTSPAATPTIASPAVVSPPAVSPAADRTKTNPFAKLMDKASPNASNGSTNPWDTGAANPRAAPVAPPPPPTTQSPGPPPVKTPYHKAPSPLDKDDDWEEVVEVENESDSDDEFTASKSARSNLAQKLFSGFLGSGSTPPPQTPPPAPPAPPAPVPPSAPAAPPPPPPPQAPAAPAPPPIAAATAGDRGALFAAIQGGKRLKSVKTVDKSGPQVSGKVLGDAIPPAHITTAVRQPSPPPAMVPQAKTDNRQSVDWYAGLASESASPVTEKMPTVTEEEPTAVPNIEVTAPDLLSDIDKSTQYKVRTLFAFEGEGDDDISFTENLILNANPSKSGGDWWYGTIIATGKSGLFPKNYVQPVIQSKAVAKFSYTADKEDEMSFVEGDELTIVEQSDGDWWMAEQGGMVFIVPASYLDNAAG